MSETNFFFGKKGKLFTECGFDASPMKVYGLETCERIFVPEGKRMQLEFVKIPKDWKVSEINGCVNITNLTTTDLSFLKNTVFTNCPNESFSTFFFFSPQKYFSHR